MDKLQADALEAQRLAQQKELELTRLSNEFKAIPEKAAKLTQRVESIRSTRAFLNDEASLRADFKRQFRLQWQGNSMGRFDYTDTAVLLVTRNERMEVLAELETEATAELEKLHEDNKRLAKQLGRSRWQF